MAIYHTSPLPSPRILGPNIKIPPPYNPSVSPQQPTEYSRGRGMPSVGSPAPHFTAKAVIGGRIKEISLSQFLQAHEWLVLVFIPMAWSFVCPTEIRAFDRRIQEFETRTASVVFCSTDSEYVLRAWNHTAEDEGGLGSVHVPLISDRSHRMSRDFGVLIESEGVAQRAMFIIDPRGIVRQVTSNDANVGRSVEEARRLIDALTFTDEFGEGCPIDWKKGDSGVKMDSEVRSKKGGSLGALSITRPPHKRTNTWSGWLPRGPSSISEQSSSSGGAHTASFSSGSPREGSRPTSLSMQGDWHGLQRNGRQLSVIEDSGETISTPVAPEMTGYFDDMTSPLDQPSTVFNMMHSAKA